jgi:hypothetical protein
MNLRMAAVSLALSTAGLCSCGSNGRLRGAEPNARFVTERGAFYLGAADGIHRVALDGSTDTLAIPGRGLTVQDVSADWRTFLLSDSETDLFVADVATGSRRPVPALARRLSVASISPDGTRIAATRHADFSLPQSKWVDDDAVVIIDVATLAVVKELPASSQNEVHHVRWAADGSAIWLMTDWQLPNQWVTLADGIRRPAAAGFTAAPPSPLRPDPRRWPTPCAASLVADKRATEITIVEPGSPSRVLVAEEGRSRGVHDHESDFYEPTLSPGCATALFGFRGTLWAADVHTGRVGKLAVGELLFFAPP